MSRRNWSQEETLMAFALYFALDPKNFDKNNTVVCKLARALGRTPSAVALKLWNLSANDKNRIALGRSGMANCSKLDRAVWEEYYVQGDALLAKGCLMLSEAIGSLLNISGEAEDAAILTVSEGKIREALVLQRVNQSYFRNTLLENYDRKCCLTGLGFEPLLVASHIKPWSVSDPATERLAASNGLLLNALHDKAFDRGFITLDGQHKIRVSREVPKTKELVDHIWRYDGCSIRLPKNGIPASCFIEYHNDVIFRH